MSSNNTLSVLTDSNDETPHSFFRQDTSYSHGGVISYPAAASLSPSSQNSHLKFAPPAELTPPPSPPQSSPSAGPGGFKFAPSLLTRATSVISKRQSTSCSPTRPSHTRALSTSTPPPPKASESTTSLDTQRRRRATKSTAFADFFSGSSELVSSFAVPPLKRVDTSPTRVLSSHQRKQSFTKSSNGSAFSLATANLFTRSGRSTSPTKAYSPSRMAIAEETPEEEDEILNLDLEDELFPGGDSMALGSAAEAFDTLFANAERLFMRIQIAYQDKHSALANARAEQRALREEWEEATERNEHLKSQIDTMGCKVREQEQMMEDLASELAMERGLRRREADQRKRSLRVVGNEEGEATRGRRGGSEGRSSLDSSGDSSDAERIWSRSGSPSSASISTMPDEVEISGFVPGAFGGGLREENMRLKARVAELEETVDGCLGLVHDV